MGFPTFEPLDPDELPHDINGTELIPQLKQAVYTAWGMGEGPCDGCPNRVVRGKCYPQFGAGDPTSDVMIVGNAPGSHGDHVVGADNEGRHRRLVDEEKIKNEPEVEFQALYAGHGYSVEGELETWSLGVFPTLRKYLFDDVRGLSAQTVTNEETPTITGFDDVYFTNSKKCPDMEGGNSDEALAQCRPYLDHEIQYVDPEVIVTWGKEAALSVSKILEYDSTQIENTEAMALPSGDSSVLEEGFIGYRGNNPAIITMPHYTGLIGKNLQAIPEYDPDEYDTGTQIEIFYQLSETIAGLLAQKD